MITCQIFNKRTNLYTLQQKGKKKLIKPKLENLLAKTETKHLPLTFFYHLKFHHLVYHNTLLIFK